MRNTNKTARNSQSSNSGRSTRFIIVFVLLMSTGAGLAGLIATGIFDWRIQEIIADYGAQKQMNSDVTDNESFYFSKDYFTARKRFIEAGRAAGAVMSQLPLSARGPAGELLTIDIAWLGTLSPKKILVHTSGVHGVEGFAGSAIQLKILANPPQPPPDSAIILIHILNPYGMAWLRRYNETNVDLNRNFRFKRTEWQETSPLYEQLDSFLNPKTDRLFDSFLLQAFYQLYRFGTQTLKNTIPTGQNFNPRGLFFYGKQLEEGPTLLIQWLKKSIDMASYIFVIDVHTGLGSPGQESLFHKTAAARSTQLSGQLKRDLTRDHATYGVCGYAFQGAYSNVFSELAHGTELDFITQEFGTYPNAYVLHALRDENRAHHFEDVRNKNQTKQRLKEAFNPDRQVWKNKVLRDGVSLFAQSAEWLDVTAETKNPLAMTLDRDKKRKPRK